MCVPGWGHGGCTRLSREFQISLISYTFHFLLVDAEVLQRSQRTYDPSSQFRVNREVSSRTDPPNGGILIRCPNHLSWLDAKEPRLYTKLLLRVWACHPVSKAKPNHPSKGSYFRRLYPRSHPLGHYSELKARGEGWNVDQLINRVLCFPAQLSVHSNCQIPPHYSWYPTKLPVHLTLNFPITVKQDLKSLNSIAWGGNSVPTWCNLLFSSRELNLLSYNKCQITLNKICLALMSQHQKQV